MFQRHTLVVGGEHSRRVRAAAALAALHSESAGSRRGRARRHAISAVCQTGETGERDLKPAPVALQSETGEEGWGAAVVEPGRGVGTSP